MTRRCYRCQKFFEVMDSTVYCWECMKKFMEEGEDEKPEKD